MHIRWFTTTGRGSKDPSTMMQNAPRWSDLTQPQAVLLALAMSGLVLFLLAANVVPYWVRALVTVVVIALALLAMWAPSSATKRVGPGRKFVAVYQPDASWRQPPTLVYEVDRSAFGNVGSGSGDASVFGSVAPNGALCLVHDGIVVWPINPPIRRLPEAPGR